MVPDEVEKAEAAGASAAPVESALEKDWREIKQQNEQEKNTYDTEAQFKNTEYPLKFNDDGSLSFFYFDAHEESYGGEIYLFGKVWQPETNQFVSCSLKVHGMERTVFALPKMKNKHCCDW